VHPGGRKIDEEKAAERAAFEHELAAEKAKAKRATDEAKTLLVKALAVEKAKAKEATEATDEATILLVKALSLEGTESAIECANYKQCLRYLEKHPKLVSFFAVEGEMCYCSECHFRRADRDIYSRGNPPTKYAIPVGWCRIPLAVGGKQATAIGAFKEWHVAYHATRTSSLQGILTTGRLAKPGDAVLVTAATFGKIAIREDTGRIRKPFKRTNRFTGKSELFDPNQLTVIVKKREKKTQKKKGAGGRGSGVCVNPLRVLRLSPTVACGLVQRARSGSGVVAPQHP
jgi:hypothetical protein